MHELVKGFGMRRVVLGGVVVIIALVGVALVVLFSQKPSGPEVASMGVEVYLSTELGSSGGIVNNNSVVSFSMPPDSGGMFDITIGNDGTAPLHNVTVEIEHISDNLTLMMLDKPAQSSDTLTLGAISARDFVAYGWPIFSPPQPGNYEIIFHIASNEEEYRFNVMVIVS